LTETRDADGSGLALGAESGAARLLGVGNRGANAVEHCKPSARKTVAAGRAGFRKAEFACSACRVRASFDARPNQLGSEQIKVVRDAGNTWRTENSRGWIASGASGSTQGVDGVATYAGGLVGIVLA
jgi:hypothetical protein